MDFENSSKLKITRSGYVRIQQNFYDISRHNLRLPRKMNLESTYTEIESGPPIKPLRIHVEELLQSAPSFGPNPDPEKSSLFFQASEEMNYHFIEVIDPFLLYCIEQIEEALQFIGNDENDNKSKGTEIYSAILNKLEDSRTLNKTFFILPESTNERMNTFRHEVRNILNPILGYFQISSLSDSQIECIKDGVKKLKKYLGRRFSPEDLQDRIWDLDQFANLIEKELEEANISYTIGKVNLEGKLKINAKAFRDHVREISKNAEDANANNLQVEIKKTNCNFLTISFRDNGNGLDPEIENQASEKGVTTKSQGGGDGLHILERFVEIRGGKFEISNNTDGEKGATVLIKLPLLKK